MPGRARFWQYDRAVELYERLLMFDPTNVDVHNNLGRGRAHGVDERNPSGNRRADP
jgi:hypothetical protein